MPKFYGAVGYGEQQNVTPGVWQDVIVERMYYGDIPQNIKKPDESDKTNDDVRIQNTFSFIADAYALEHFFNIRYVVWAGACWKVDSVEVNMPRLTLRVGGIYNGVKA